MLFDSLAYWVFFSAVLVTLAALPAGPARLALVAAGFVFYSFWNPWFVLLLGGSILGNFLLGRWVGMAEGNRRRFAVTMAITANLCLLGFFKYYGFLIHTVASLSGSDLHSLLLNITLPVGISFITFEGIAYAVDVYRRDTPAVRSLTDFGVFISFFPHLVAGPIIRPAHFFPQLASRPALTDSAARWGVIQIVKGLLKKVVFADYFAPIANAFFSHGSFSGQAVPASVGVFAFSLQIYFDFAGYTDIARGCARLLGYEFPPNFERPYFSRNIAEFWRRWHISLSSWLRDYLYLPLGGNRRGSTRTCLNIIVVMALGGLWHGASWNFALWGLYHGGLLLGHRAWAALTASRTGVTYPFAWLTTTASMLLTFVAVTVGWIPFRSPDFAFTMRAVADLGAKGGIQFLQSTPTYWVLGAFSILYCLADRERKLERWLGERAPLAVVAALVAVGLVLLELFGQFGLKIPFIYFQF